MLQCFVSMFWTFPTKDEINIDLFFQAFRDARGRFLDKYMTYPGQISYVLVLAPGL